MIKSKNLFKNPKYVFYKLFFYYIFTISQMIYIQNVESHASNHNLYSGFDSIDNDLDEYALDIAIKLKRDYSDDPISDLFATSYGLEKIARLSELDNNLFHFKFSNRHIENQDYMNPAEFSFDLMKNKKTKRHIHNKIVSIREDDRVEYVLPQIYLSRHKRALNIKDMNEKELAEFLDELSEKYVDKKNKRKISEFNDLSKNLYSNSIERGVNYISNKNGHENQKRKQELKIITKQFFENVFFDLPKEINFNDQNYNQQWYLINEGQMKIPLTHDLNVREAWLKGYSGKNVTIVIIDDGLDHEHPDFLGKYRHDLSYDFNDENDLNHDPMPATFDNQNNHGTRCAGAAAARANNSICGVGIAYDAQIAGIRILDGPITDLLEARALSYKSKYVDIRSASWGPKDDGSHMEYPGPFVNLALEDGVKNGRNGRGTLYVWASGNGGGNDDDCSCDGYVSHWNIISIGSVNHRGLKPYFMELCPSTMAVVYSGGQSNIDGDIDDPGVRVVASDVRGKCTTTFQGTSAAAPLAAGALALVLEANPYLTYRDVMHLIAKTSRIPNIEDTSGWIVNGAKYHVNEKYGFGVIDVSQMLQEAQYWSNVSERKTCIIEYQEKLPELGSNDKKEISISTFSCTEIDSLEHVIANISFTFSSRGDLKMILISPQGTPSEILSFRKNDKNNKGVKYFPFMTLFNWGETPKGIWKLVIETRKNRDEDVYNYGKIDYFSLVLFGTKNAVKRAIDDKRYVDYKTKAYIPSDEDVKMIYNEELRQSRQTRIIHKRVLDGNPELRNLFQDLENFETD